jgi:cytochrome c-type protein NapC
MRSETPTVLVLVAMLIALAVAAGAYAGFRHLAIVRWGRLALLVAAALLPIAASVAGLQAGVAESSRTRFCLGCHEMQAHGRSLFVDDKRSLAAVHYQNRLIDRDRVCYACHTDYALFGDAKSKLAGLRHVWAHYTGQIPAQFKLYEPYKNYNCLHCHEDGRRYLEQPAHASALPQMASGQTSCLSCHNVAHDPVKVGKQELWGPGAR